MASTSSTLSTDGKTKKPLLEYSLPEEIIAEIMSRLPAKLILKFKSVCKCWYSLFSKPSFIQMHLHRTVAKGNTSVLLRHIAPEEKRGYRWKKIRMAVYVATDEQGTQTFTYRINRRIEENFSLRSNTDFQVIRKPRLPMLWRRRFTYVVGSSHGIICIAENDRDKTDVDLALWNPATGELKALPGLANERSDCYVVALGFTYNPELNDYQVVSIFINGSNIEAQIFSVSTNRWRQVDDAKSLRCTFRDFRSRVNLGGNMHWLAFETDGDILWHHYIVYLDTTTDKFGTFECPQFCTRRKEALLQSHCLASEKKESLLMFVYDSQHIPGCDVWLMQEYGDSNSWTKLYSFPLKFRMRPIGNYLVGPECEFLIGRVEDDPEEGNLYACCTRRVTFRNLLARSPTCIVGHMETLVSIAQLQAALPGSSSSASTSNVT